MSAGRERAHHPTLLPAPHIPAHFSAALPTTSTIRPNALPHRAQTSRHAYTRAKAPRGRMRSDTWGGRVNGASPPATIHASRGREEERGGRTTANAPFLHARTTLRRGISAWLRGAWHGRLLPGQPFTTLHSRDSMNTNAKPHISGFFAAWHGRRRNCCAAPVNTTLAT